LRVPSEETIDMQPAVREEPAPPSRPVLRSNRPAPAPPRTGTERLVLAVLLLGLALNALVLLRHAALSRADVLLGATVLLAGVALLVLMEVYRRVGR
jgi:fatty acid desaturase